jgi:GTP cyclohydrolase I
MGFKGRLKVPSVEVLEKLRSQGLSYMRYEPATGIADGCFVPPLVFETIADWHRTRKFNLEELSYDLDAVHYHPKDSRFAESGKITPTRKPIGYVGKLALGPETTLARLVDLGIAWNVQGATADDKMLYGCFVPYRAYLRLQDKPPVIDFDLSALTPVYDTDSGQGHWLTEATDHISKAAQAVSECFEPLQKFVDSGRDPLEAYLQCVLEDVFGTDVWDDSPEDTVRRLLKFWREFKPVAEPDFNFTTFPATVNQLIICQDIEFASLCSHHLAPFYGKAHIGYIPNKKQVGLSKLPRTVEHFARRPQVQEQLTEQIATFVKDQLECHGVMVVIEARHTCMSCRGVRTHNGVMRTSETRGVFMSSDAARAEFLTLIGRPTV